MNAPAPQAPVAASSVSVAETLAAGKNRKHPGTGTPSALATGPSKGSALFAQLLNARAAARARTAIPVKMASGQTSRAAAGLKAAVVAAIAGPSVPAAAKTPVAAHLPAAQALKHAEDSAAAVAKNTAARKKTETPETASVLAHAAPAGHGGPTAQAVATKEQNNIIADNTPASAVESAKAVAHRPEPLVHIVDLRRQEKPSKETSSARRLESVPSQDRDSSTIVARPLFREAAMETPARPTPVASPAPATPLERLREMAGSELVRASQLVLRDGGGEIRLVLKPESLGSVRVRMNLVDNAIEGRIIVDSAAVKHVLDGSVDALRRALTAEGFQMGSLQVSVGGQDAQSDPRRRQDETPTEVRRVAAQGFERSVPGAEDVSLGDLFVNLFV